MIDKIRSENVDFLFNAILELNSVEECYKFFDDLCTVPELKARAQRCVVAHMLRDGDVYNNIVEKTGASTATISRVNRSLQYGNNGYEIVFDRLKKEV